MTPFNWKCPNCGHAQVVTDSTYDNNWAQISQSLGKFGYVGLRYISTVCSNAECKEMTLSLHLIRTVRNESGYFYPTEDVLHSWSLLPESSAKPQPLYIPEPIVENYKQACRIRDLSANASATMSRRCLQGIIHDFCKIHKRTLAQEIDTLRKQLDEGNGPQGVSHDTVAAIDHFRSIGNIGAHMEKDINLVLDVEPQEAQALISLIELLFEEWYVARHVREEKLKQLGIILENKRARKEKTEMSQAPETLPAPEHKQG